MAYSNPFVFNIDEYSMETFERRFATFDHNDMRQAGAYRTVPTNGGVHNAPLQQIPMGNSGPTPPMTAGMMTSQHMRPSVAQHPTIQGVSTTFGPSAASTAFGMRPSMPTASLPITGISMVSGPQYAQQPVSMQMSPASAYQNGIWPAPMHQAVPEQRPAPVFTPTQMGYGATFSAPTGSNASIGPLAQAPAPALPEVIDLTNDNDDEPVGPTPTTTPSVPATQHAGTKRRRADGASKKSSKPEKKPRFTRMEASALPSPPRSSSAAPSLPSSSSSSSSGVEVLPSAPSPVKQQPTPRKKRADPHNLLGSFHYTYVQKPVNHQLASSASEETEKIARPLYSSDLPPQRKRADKLPKKSPESSGPSKTKGKKSGKSAKAPKPSEPSPQADEESDAEFELDDEYGAPTTVESAIPAAASATVASDSVTATSPAEESDDQFAQIAVDDDGNVICRPDGLPMSASEWEAQEAATKEAVPEFDGLVLETSPEANTISTGEPAQGAPILQDADDLNALDDAALKDVFSKAVAAAEGQSADVDEDDEDDEDDDADFTAALEEAMGADEGDEVDANAASPETFQPEESDGEISEDES